MGASPRSGVERNRYLAPFGHRGVVTRLTHGPPALRRSPSPGANVGPPSHPGLRSWSPLPDCAAQLDARTGRHVGVAMESGQAFVIMQIGQARAENPFDFRTLRTPLTIP